MSVDPIRCHLRTVVRTLRTRDVADPVRSRRTALLDLLDDYAEGGRFPRWDHPVSPRPRRHLPPRYFDGPGPRAPRFRDHEGTWCAVGYLVAHTDLALAEEIASRFGPCWLDEMDEPRLAAWARAHGFTTDELAWIQPGYCWQPPVCDDIVVEDAVLPAETTCTGADPLLYNGYGVQFCQECAGPFRVWATVQNPGTQVAVGVAVELWGPGGVVDRVDLEDLPAAGAVLVELSTASVGDVGTYGGLRLVAAADCDPGGEEVQIWDDGNGGPGWVLPDECGGSCDTGVDTATSSTDTGRPPKGDGCGGCAVDRASTWTALVGLPFGLLVRRR